jgi:hypothetical protein
MQDKVNLLGKLLQLSILTLMYMHLGNQTYSQNTQTNNNNEISYSSLNADRLQNLECF